jgi:hypothetical protein
MAKSIRSKVKRANRSLHRKAVADPIIQKRQQKLAANLQKTLNEKSGSSIVGLRSVLSANAPPKKDDDIEDVEEEEVKVDKKSDAKKIKVKALTTTTAKSNPTKKLVWFK